MRDLFECFVDVWRDHCTRDKQTNGFGRPAEPIEIVMIRIGTEPIDSCPYAATVEEAFERRACQHNAVRDGRTQSDESCQVARFPAHSALVNRVLEELGSPEGG